MRAPHAARDRRRWESGPLWWWCVASFYVAIFLLILYYGGKIQGVSRIYSVALLSSHVGISVILQSVACSTHSSASLPCSTSRSSRGWDLSGDGGISTAAAPLLPPAQYSVYPACFPSSLDFFPISHQTYSTCNSRARGTARYRIMFPCPSTDPQYRGDFDFPRSIRSSACFVAVSPGGCFLNFSHFSFCMGTTDTDEAFLGWDRLQLRLGNSCERYYWQTRLHQALFG